MPPAPRKQTKAETLERALLARGHVPPAELDEDSRALVRDTPRRIAALAALARRGWVEWFDLEDDFHVTGSHARQIGQLLVRCGVDDATVRDAWIPSRGRCVEVTRGSERRGFFGPSEHLSDWGQLDLMLEATRSFAKEQRRTVLSVDTRDQTVCLVCVPDDVRAAVKAALPIVSDEQQGTFTAHDVALDELDALLLAANAADEARKQSAKRAEAPRVTSIPPLADLGEELWYGGAADANLVEPASIRPPLALAMLHERVTSGLPVLAGGRMFVLVSEVSAARTRLVARGLREENGELLWERELPCKRPVTQSTCLLLGGEALVCSAEEGTSVLDPRSGEVLAFHAEVLPWLSTATVVGTNLLCVGPQADAQRPNDGSALHFFSPRDNVIHWSLPVEHFPTIGAAAGALVVLSPTRTSIAAFDARTGRQAWAVDVGVLGQYEDLLREKRAGEPLALAIFDADRDPFVVVGIDGYTLLALDLATGAERWTCKVPIRRPRFTASADRTLHLLGYGGGGERYCRVAADGGALLVEHDLSTWARTRDGTVIFHGLAPSDAHVFFITGIHIHAMRIDDGVVEWSAQLVVPTTKDPNELSNANHSLPAIVNGRLHVVTMGCRLHTFVPAPLP